MDYGFVRGEVVIEQENGPLITSKEGYNCYLIIVDEYSRHIWVFLFAGKSPPAETITKFLDAYGFKTGLRFVRTDQGGELAESTLFRKSISDAGYVLDRTGAGVSFQNGIAARSHRTLADMMRTMLIGANLLSDYWSHAIIHAVYVKNRLPHQALPGHITPFERYTS